MSYLSDCRAPLILSLASLLVFSSCKEKEQAPPAVPEVEVTAVEQRNVPIFREWVGSLTANINATISAQVSGYLLRQDYKEGQPVKQGDLLFEIDDRTFQSVLDQAEAKLRKTELDVQRYTPLAASEAISKQELDDAIQANLVAKAAADEARLNVEFCKITSPIDGVAGLAQPGIGDLIGPGSGPLTTVVKIDPIRVHFSVDQQLLSQMQEKMLAEGKVLRSDMESSQGPELELILLSGAAYPQKGRVIFADNQIDVKTGTIRVVGEFPNSEGLLSPGMFVRVRAQLGMETNALLVPQRAVADMQGRSLLAVVGASNQVSILPVTTGERLGGDWVVQGNVKAGDRVVAEGVQKVRDGMVVNPIPFKSPPAAASETSPAAQAP